MRYKAKTSIEYIDNLDNDWRKEKVQEIRKIIKSIVPSFKEKIHYNMLGYCDDKGFVFHLNAQKNYVSFYVGNTKIIDPEGLLLKGFNIGEGCIRIKKSIDLSESRLDEFIKNAYNLRKQNIDFDC